MNSKPRIAVILDENTSGDASRYEASKGYFRAIGDAGGLPFGIPYLPEIVDVVVDEFDGLLCVGGRFAYPDEWYLRGESSKAPRSERYEVERAIVEGYLAHDKPILGICAGMQLLACLNGCRLWPDVQASVTNALEHDKPGYLHQISLVPGSTLAALALLWQMCSRSRAAERSSTVWASLQQWSDEADYSMAHGGQAGLRWWPVGCFFPALLARRRCWRKA